MSVVVIRPYPAGTAIGQMANALLAVASPYSGLDFIQVHDLVTWLLPDLPEEQIWLLYREVIASLNLAQVVSDGLPLIETAREREIWRGEAAVYALRLAHEHWAVAA